MPGRLSSRALLGVLLLGSSLPALALEVGDERLFSCVSGDCRNGVGQARSVSGSHFEGRWRNGHSIPGESYVLSHPLRPEQRWRAEFAENGLLQSGQQLYPLGLGRNFGVFDGSYAHIDHPFARMKIAVPARGSYHAGTGFRYRGRFEYLPGKSTMTQGVISGSYIFFGQEIDDEDPQSAGKPQLYISFESAPFVALSFQPASPTYLARLQRRYQEDLQTAKGEFDRMDSERRWRDALAVIGKIGLAVVSGGTSAALQAVANEAAMNLVGQLLKNPDSGASLEDATNQAIAAASAGVDGAQAALQEAVKK